MRSAVFFERDGVLNRHVLRDGHMRSPLRVEQFEVLMSVVPGLEVLKRAGFLRLVATHQPDVSRGLISRNEVAFMHRILAHKLPIDDISLCASDDPTHPCAKPQPGLFTEAAHKWNLDLDRCFVISDKWQDAKAAQIVGCTSIMIDSPWVGDDHHDILVPDFASAIQKVLLLHAENRRGVPLTC